MSINSVKYGVYIMVVKNVEQLNSLKSDVEYMISIMVEDALAQTDEFYEYLSIEDALSAVTVFPATVENTEALVC